MIALFPVTPEQNNTMLKTILGIAPQQEPDGSYKPSKLAMKLSTSDTTNYEPVEYVKYQGPKSKILVLFTEQKNMKMKNGKAFSTGNHPVEALLPMLHLQKAGFEFDVVTLTGKPVVFEMWAMPQKDEHVLRIYNQLKPQLNHPRSLSNIINELDHTKYAAIFIPGGHGVMLGIPDDPKVGKVLRWAHENELHTISLCHGPAAFLSTTLEGGTFLYAGYKMAVFPDQVDQKTPLIGYLPGPMPHTLSEPLKKLGVKVVNTKADDTCCQDRTLITGASPLASNRLGKLAASTLLAALK